MKDIHARIPVNAITAIVMSKGFQYKPNKKILTADSDTPLKIKPTPYCKNGTLVGKRVGRFIVIGFSAEISKRWVVRCDCGKYSLRSAKAISNPNNEQDCCEECRHLLFLKQRDIKNRTGKDINDI